MTGIDANSMFAVLAVLIPLLGGGVLLWQRTTAAGRETAAWQATVDARLTQVEKRLEKLDGTQEHLRDCVQDIKVTLNRYINGALK